MSEAPAPTDTPAAPAKKSRGMLYGILGGAGVLGALGGFFLIGPRVAGGHAAPADTAAAEADGGEHETGKGKMVRLDNVIVNPAGSQGMRFLMISVALEVTDPKVESHLRERDVELRDALITILSGMSMEVLSAPAGRDSVKQRIGTAAQAVVGHPARIRVFLPQFVIQ